MYDPRPLQKCLDRYRKANAILDERLKTSIAEAFPETGGSLHLLHNWFLCYSGEPSPRNVEAESIVEAYHKAGERIDRRRSREIRYAHKACRGECSRLHG